MQLDRLSWTASLHVSKIDQNFVSVYALWDDGHTLFTRNGCDLKMEKCSLMSTSVQVIYLLSSSNLSMKIEHGPLGRKKSTCWMYGKWGLHTPNV